MTQSRVEQLKEILAQDANNLLTRYALAMEYSNSGDVDAAVAEFKLLLEKHPDYANAYFMAAQSLAGADAAPRRRKCCAMESPPPSAAEIITRNPRCSSCSTIWRDKPGTKYHCEGVT